MFLKSLSGKTGQKISDDKVEFDIDGIKCGAEKTFFAQHSDDSIWKNDESMCLFNN